MQKLIAAFLFCLMWAQVAHAEKLLPMDPKVCRKLIKHTPDADVEYQPGVDVNGNPVAPAGLPGQPQIKMPEKIEVPVTVNLAKVLNLNNQYPNNQLGAGTEAVIGALSVVGDKAYFNDQPLSDEQQDNLAVLCMEPTDGN